MAQKYSSKKPLSATQLKQFRKDLSSLKKQGLIPGKTDARIARPFFYRDGKTLAEWVNKYQDKIGLENVKKDLNAKLYSVPPGAAPPKKKTQKLLPANELLSVHRFPTKAKSLAKFLKDIDENYESLNAMKRADDRFAFQIDGMRSYALFYDIRDLSEYLSESAGIQMVLKKRSKSQAVFDALRIVRWAKTSKEWKPAKQRAKRPSRAKEAATKRRRK